MKKITFLVASLSAVVCFSQSLTVTHEGTYETGIFDDGGTEIIAYDPLTQQIFSTNGANNALDILDFSNPNSISLVQSISLSSYGGHINSVAVKNGIVAIAMEATVKTDSGHIVLFNTNGVFQNQFTVGALPDMVTFTPDGSKIISANEGEPNNDYSIDPNGSISIIELNGGGLFTGTVTTIDFTAFNASTLVGVRLKAGANVAADLEPEYVSTNAAGTIAYITLQENNAMAIVNLSTKQITDVVPFGLKDHNQVENKLDASDKGNNVNFMNYANVFGMYMPDGIASFEVNGNTFLVTANEGDGRDYNGYGDESRVKDLTLDSTAFPNAAALQLDTVLGRLTVSEVDGDLDGDGDHDQLWVYGARSFSIWNNQGVLVYDSGDDIAQQVFMDFPAHFNATNDDNDSYKNRSDNKGAEPEAVVTFKIGNIQFLAVGLERIGGFMIYDISNPNAPQFLNYTNNRNFLVDADSSAAGDLAPEGLIFIDAANSPNGKNYLVSSNEVSGTVSAFSLSGYGIGIEENGQNATTTIWPNPVTDILYFSAEGEYSLLDASGKVVQTVSGSIMNVKHLAAGAYILLDEKGVSHKVLKQ